jgi:hypothetical protein
MLHLYCLFIDSIDELFLIEETEEVSVEMVSVDSDSEILESEMLDFLLEDRLVVDFKYRSLTELVKFGLNNSYLFSNK